MDWWIAGGIGLVVVALGWLAQRAGIIDLSNRSRDKRGGLGGILGIGDEVFAPTRYEAAIERDRQSSLPAPAPLAGDGDHGIYDGQVVIDITRTQER